MERHKPRRRIRRYDRGQMQPTEPRRKTLDELFRDRLKELIVDQKTVAKRIRRSQGWLNKYINGSGKATIDDVLRLVAIVVLGVGAPQLTREQRKLLRDFESLAPADRRMAKRALAAWRERRPERHPKSSNRTE